MPDGSRGESPPHLDLAGALERATSSATACLPFVLCQSRRAASQSSLPAQLRARSWCPRNLK
ncbi:hypothetical protein HBI56_220120 [Parastagonospora nodorum]|nr:hypothetical protein HBH49_096740 [Parastagonospora nodorum]KAH4112982.1 hypothetical protein HBH47_217120 [Parastagonospora nodorum]KAH4384100.1 hypothetical protein HBH94_048130 [Parastagonospora nodorum]KAH4702273.1 hypothetical protein HBH79_029420 [Parastagonospora nodorum]KAH4833087.1 hypothetical protein HBH60_049030 [Parastagonospora nodorum]